MTVFVQFLSSALARGIHGEIKHGERIYVMSKFKILILHIHMNQILPPTILLIPPLISIK